MALQLYNSFSRQKEEFKPINPPFVGVYVCGPTVYDHPHLGHAKSYVVFDVIVRYLRAIGYKVRYVQNITDVGHLVEGKDEGEDKIQKKAKIEKLEPIEIAQKYENIYFQSMDQLNNLRPDISCRATGHIMEMIEAIENLIAKGNAYVADGNVYFNVRSISDYGKLSRRKIDDQMEGTRIETAKDKKNSFDFALWKKTDPDHIMYWKSPWGNGYPGWHIECSVMSIKYLGKPFDIHGGGLDNQFPHHECEIAQSEAMTGGKFVNYFIHNNMITIKGEKMSKSKGNFFTLKDLFAEYNAMAVRFFILQGHYHSPQEMSDESLTASNKGYQRIASTLQQLENIVIKQKIMEYNDDNKSLNKQWDNLSGSWLDFKQKFIEHMDDNFDTPGAIATLFEICKYINSNLLTTDNHDNSEITNAYSLLKMTFSHILGFQTMTDEIKHSQENELIELILNLRNDYRDNKNWQKSDFIRDELNKLGIIIKDSKDKTTYSKELT